MNRVADSRRVPWKALALSFLATGLGHIYCGRVGKGLVLFCAWFLLPVLAIVAALLVPSNSVLVGLILAPAIGMFLIYLYAAVDAFSSARRINTQYTLKDYNRSLVYVMLILVGLVYPIGVTTTVRALAFEAFIVATSSMGPGLLADDRVLVNKLVGRNRFPNRGDVVAFRNPGEGASVFLKRVIALPGDTVELRGRELLVNGQSLTHERVPKERLGTIAGQIKGEVYDEVNGARRYGVIYLPEPQTSHSIETHREYSPTTVPERTLFLLGDNRDVSLDSRNFGFVPVQDVIGYVQYVYLPAANWSRFGVFRD